MAIAVTATRLAAVGSFPANMGLFTLGATPTHGSTILVTIGIPTISDLVTQVTDTRGNVYTRILDTGVHNPPGLRGWVYACFSQKDLVAGDCVIIVTNGTSMVVAIDEVTGLGSDPANTPDETAYGFSGTDVATYTTATSAATGFANELVWVAIIVAKNGGTQSITPGAGYTQQGARLTNFQVGMYTQYKIVSGTGTQLADGAFNTQNDKYVMGLVTLPDPQTPGNTYRAASVANMEIAGKMASRAAGFVGTEVAAITGPNRAAGFLGIEVACVPGTPPPAGIPTRPLIIVA